MALNLPVYDPNARTAKPKPSALPRKVRQHEKKLARREDRKAEEREERARQTAYRRANFTRDKGRSRFSGLPLKWSSENPAEIGHSHHVKFRAVGGSDELFNRVLLTPYEHEMAHARHPKYVLDISGDANETLTFTQREIETGKVALIVESANPSIVKGVAQ